MSLKGSATSGHVQKNLSYVKPEFFRQKVSSNTGKFGETSYDDKSNNLSAYRDCNPDILEHRKKKELEAKLYEFTVIIYFSVNYDTLTIVCVFSLGDIT